MKALQGSDYILFFRLHKLRETESAAKLFFQTEHSLEKSKDAETTQTKDGSINTPGADDNSLSISSVAYSNDDSTQELWELLEEWLDAGEKVEVWEVNRYKKNTEGSYRARYLQGVFVDFSQSAPSDGVSEIEMTFQIDGAGTKGFLALSEEQQEVAQYAFTDLEPTAVGV